MRTEAAHVAILTTSTGALVMPARSPYEREVLFDNAAFYGAREEATLEMRAPRRSMRVRKPVNNDACVRCTQAVRQIAFELRGAIMCRRCIAAA